MYNIIFHVTTFCNFDCSYCDVIKDKKNPTWQTINSFMDFIRKNTENIGRVKFFWWEPLINFKDIKTIVAGTHWYVWNRYEIVSNTSLLDDQKTQFLSEYFEIIFLSLDAENDFDYDYISHLLDTYKLDDKVYINLIIHPRTIWKSLEQFKFLYNNSFKNFNILPVYFTADWTSIDLKLFSSVMKQILEIALKDKDVSLYWFQENMWLTTSLSNNTVFVDIDGRVYYSDMVSTYKGSSFKKSLYLWHISSLDLDEVDNIITQKNMRNIIDIFEEQMQKSTKGQKELHTIMDYFSKYLNTLN